MISEKILKKFLLKNKTLKDKKVHMLAAKYKLTPDKVEEQIYKIARKGLFKKVK